MKEEFNKAGRRSVPDKGIVRSRSTRTVDVEKYKDFLDGTDMTDDRKIAYLNDIWSVVDAFVLESFGIHPVQEVCGKVAANSPEAPTEAFNRVSLANSETFKRLTSLKPMG